MALVARTVQLTSFSPLRSSIHRPRQIFLSSRIAKYGKTPSWCTKCTIQSRRNDGFTEKSTNEKRLMALVIVKAASIPAPEENKDSSFRRILLSDVVVKQRNDVYRDRKWSMGLGVLVAMHLLCLFAPFTFQWGAFWVAVGLSVITGLLGITLSFHRNLTHRSFKLPRWLEYFFAYCGVHALQGSPIEWVSIHRYHHQFCDTEKDPHSPTKGFWFSHMMWLFDIKLLAEKCGERNNVGDLQKQPFYRFLENTYVLHPIALTALIYAMGGFPYVVWGMLVISGENKSGIPVICQETTGGWLFLHLEKGGITITMLSNTLPDMDSSGGRLT